MLGSTDCEQGPSTTENVYRAAAIITGAMAASVFVYAIVVEIFRRQGLVVAIAGETVPTETMRVAFFAVAVSLIPLVRVIRARILQRSPGDSSQQLMARLVRSSIVTASICEVPAVLGLVLFLLGGAVADFYVLFAASLGMFILYFPRLERWRDWLGSAGHPAPPTSTQ